MRTLRSVAMLLLVLILLGSCGLGKQPAELTPGTAEQPAEAPHAEAPAAGTTPADPLASALQGLDLDTFFEASWRELSLRDPEAVLTAGVADFYGLEGAELTDISDAYQRRTYEMYGIVLDLLRQYNRDQLSPAQQVSYDVYEWWLASRVEGQAFMYYDYPVTYCPVTAVHEGMAHFFIDLHPLASLQDAQGYVTRLGQVDTKFEQLIAGLRLREAAGVIPPRFAIEWALYGVRNMASAEATESPFYTVFAAKLEALPGIEEGQKMELLRAAESAVESAVLPAYRALGEVLEIQVSIAPSDDGVWRFPQGEAYYAYLLRRQTTTRLTAGEIHELGLRELDRIHAEMRVLFDELGYPQDEALPELFDRVAQDSPTIPAREVLGTYETIIDEAARNLDTVFALYPRTPVQVIESPIKGMYERAPLDGSRPAFFHAGPGDAPESYYAMPTLAYHETIPGHHLQIALAQEADLPAFRTSVGFTGFAEGWALYAERLAWELGWYDDDPYGDLGRLQAEAFRAARLVVDTGIHARRWTFQQALDFFVENTGFAPGDSVEPEIEIARYVVWPGQSTAYLVGMLEILALRQRAMDRLGDRFDLKEFHTIVLRNGSMPLEVLERVVDSYVEAALAH
jgi:uncharacterized protein (DUF885 family)